MKATVILSFLLIVLMGSVASAEINNYASVKQNENVTLSQVCASCSYVNMSVKYPAPNSSYVLYEVEMDRDGLGDWYYEFCNTSLVGRYDVTGHGDISGTDTGFDVLYFEVTPSGSILDTASSTTLLGSLLVMLIFSILFMFMATKTDSLAGKVTLYCIGGLGLLMSILYTVVTIQQVLFGFDGIITGIEAFLMVIKVGVGIGIIALGIVIFLIMLKAFRIKRGLVD